MRRERIAVAAGRCSVRTGGYCRPLQRLPLKIVSALPRRTGRLLCQKARTQWLSRGRAANQVDGAWLSMLDIQEDQACYPRLTPRPLASA